MKPEIVTDEARKAVLGRMAQRALAHFGEMPDRRMFHVKVAERDIQLRLSIHSNGDKTVKTVFAIPETEDWGCMVDVEQVRQPHRVVPHRGRRVAIPPVELPPVVGMVQFQGDWKRFEQDAVLLGLALGGEVSG